MYICIIHKYNTGCTVLGKVYYRTQVVKNSIRSEHE